MSKLSPKGHPQSVSHLITEKYGISAKPGAKVECPFCHHKTFSIKSDDSLGKCFHPSCGRFITPFQQQKESKHLFQNTFEEIFHLFHAELLRLKDSKGRNAYSYLVEERRIHPQVVAHSMLGAVPSGELKLEELFRPIIEEIEKEIEEEKEERKEKRGRPKKKIEPESEERLQFVLEVQKKFFNCISGQAGWLCFFYTDTFHRIVAIRFRQPYSKKIVYFKPFKNAGLFGHGLFTPYTADCYQSLNDCLIVVEGEFNQLQLQSLTLRYGETVGEQMGYLFSCAVGGVENADLEAIRKIAKNPIVCYDNDEAGFELVKNAQEIMSLSAFTTPEPDSDLDEFILSFGADSEAAWRALKDLLTNRKAFYRSYEALKNQIFYIRQRHGQFDKRRGFEINAHVASIVKDDLHDRGKFYNDGLCSYFFYEFEKELLEINPENDESRFMLARYGINASENIFKYLMESLFVEAFEKGEKVKVHKLSFYNPETFTLYLFNHKNQVYRISPEKIDLVDNGTDGVLFLRNLKNDPFEADKPLDDSESLLDKFIVSRINFAIDVLSPDERKIVFSLWLYSVFFESIMPTKAILAFIGPKGSGKSNTLRKVGKLLLRKDFDTSILTDDSKDFDAAVTNSPFFALDNADAKYKWLNDRLATVATGGDIKRRRLYTTNILMELPARCFVSIASRTPYFRRDDVADRLLIMRVDRFQAFLSERMLLNEVIENRDRIWSEVVLHLQEIVGALKEEKNANDPECFRMADFADFALKIGRYAGIEEEVKSIFKKLSQEQSTFTLEDDPIFELLCTWSKQNPGKEVTNTMLCQELCKLAKDEKVSFPFEDKTRSFAQRMSNIRSNLAEFFTITERKARGRKTFYTYVLREEETGNA